MAISSPVKNGGFYSMMPHGEDVCLLSDFSDNCARKRFSAFAASAEDEEITSRRGEGGSQLPGVKFSGIDAVAAIRQRIRQERREGELDVRMRDAERHRVGDDSPVGVQRQTNALMLCGMQRKRRKRIDLHGIKSGAGEVLKRAQSGANGVVIAFQRQRAGGGFIAVLQVLCELGNQMLVGVKLLAEHADEQSAQIVCDGGVEHVRGAFDAAQTPPRRICKAA